MNSQALKGIGSLGHLICQSWTTRCHTAWLCDWVTFVAGTSPRFYSAGLRWSRPGSGKANTKNHRSAMFSWICLKVPHALNTTLKQSVDSQPPTFCKFLPKTRRSRLFISQQFSTATHHNIIIPQFFLVFPCYLILHYSPLDHILSSQTDPAGVCNAQRPCKVTSLS